MGAPRVIFMRHGETEWSLTGQHTGTTDIPLLPEGADCVAHQGRALVGKGRMVDARKVAHVFCSPRLRALQTMDLFLAEHKWDIAPNEIVIDDRIREWTYGIYEGKTPAEIVEMRGGKKLYIWKDGCPEGENPQQITERLDALISDIRTIHRISMSNEEPGDVLVFGHGHILRAFVMRWMGWPLADYHPMVLPAGGVGVLGYEHDNLDEPAWYLGQVGK